MEKFSLLVYLSLILALISFVGVLFLLQKEFATPKTNVDEELMACEKLSYEMVDARNACFRDLAIKRRDPNLCLRITGTGVFSRYDCIREIAIRTKNPDVCNSILTLYDKNECFQELAIELDNVEICEKITDITDKNGCYFFFAAAKNDIKFCDKITLFGRQAISRESCYAKIGKNNKNPGICEELSSPANPDDCYYQFAVSYPREREVCQKIKDEKIKKSCLQEIQAIEEKK